MSSEEVEEMSVAQILFAEEFTLYTEAIPLRPVGPAVSTRSKLNDID